MPIVDKGKYFTYAEAKAYVAKLEIKTYKQWLEFLSDQRKNTRESMRLPTNPRTFYGETVFKSWGDFFGTEAVSNKEKGSEFLSYGDAKKIVHALKISSIGDYREFLQKTGTSELPAAPEKYYRKNGGSFSWKDFLHPRLLSYKDAKKALAPFGLKRYSDFLSMRKRGVCPDGVPSNPASHYVGEWASWEDFLSVNEKSSLLHLIKNG